MLWETLAGILLALLILIGFSLALSALVQLFERLIGAWVTRRPGWLRAERIRPLARFAAVVAITLLAGAGLLLRFGG